MGRNLEQNQTLLPAAIQHQRTSTPPIPCAVATGRWVLETVMLEGVAGFPGFLAVVVVGLLVVVVVGSVAAGRGLSVGLDGVLGSGGATAVKVNAAG